MFSDFNLSSLRLFALFSHFLVSIVLFWTRGDTIGVSFSVWQSASEYSLLDNQMLALLSLNLICLLVESIILGFIFDAVRLDSCIHLVLDISATFFITWMILDGWTWSTFIYIFLFCSLLPTSYDLLWSMLFVFKGQFRSGRRTPTLAKRIWYFWKTD